MIKIRITGCFHVWANFFFIYFRVHANAPPTTPNSMPSRIIFPILGKFISIFPVSAKENFSSPKNCDVALAVKAAVIAGSRAWYSRAPATRTSIAKKTAAMGVSKSPANPAAIPVKSIKLTNCTFPVIINGISFNGITSSSPCPASKIKFMPLLLFPPNFR